MRRRAYPLVLALALLMTAAAQARPAPEFTETAKEDWLNSAPITMASLKGQVVLVDFWTFACWNCYRSFPWLNSLEDKLEGEAFQVIGVHSPEFDYERNPEAIRKKIAEFELKHPVMIDNDHRYWRAMNNRYWPAFYLIDKKGEIREVFIGETHTGDKRAKKIEAKIRELLDE
ncbi:MAG: redoxin family protein [Pseudomonadota bacterium]